MSLLSMPDYEMPDYWHSWLLAIELLILIYSPNALDICIIMMIK